MKHTRFMRLLVVATILLASAQALAQTPVNYRCRRPKTGSHAVQYRWYICRPDSNTLIYQSTTTDTFATIVHQRDGERVRAVAVDALGRAGLRSTASAAWALVIATGIPSAGVAQLHAVYPNPFNPRTTVSFDLPESQRARVVIYGIDGRQLRMLLDAQLPAGSHALVWDGQDGAGQAVASGVYVCRLETSGKTQSVRMTLVR